MAEANEREVKRYGIEAVGEMDHCAVGLEQERQRTGVGRQVVRQTCGIFGRLRLDAPERSLGLGFDRMADTHPFRGRSADHSPRPRKPSLAKDRWLFFDQLCYGFCEAGYTRPAPENGVRVLLVIADHRC